MPLGLFKFRNGSAKSGDRHIVNSAEMEAIFPESHSSQKLLQSPDPIEDGMYDLFHENSFFLSFFLVRHRLVFVMATKIVLQYDFLLLVCHNIPILYNESKYVFSRFICKFKVHSTIDYDIRPFSAFTTD